MIAMLENARVASSSGRLAWDLADRIGEASALFNAVLSDVVAATPLTVGEAIALVVLASAPAGRTQAGLGRALGVSRQHAHATVRRLRDLGLARGVRRGREVAMLPTPRGERLLEKARPAAEARLARAVSALTAAERSALHGLCGRLVEVLARDGARRDP